MDEIAATSVDLIVNCGLEVDSHEGDFLTLNESQYNGTRTESLHRNLKK
jgi:hypothetical protein